MMRREMAYRLAGRKHLPNETPSDTHCHRQIRFQPQPAGQAARALLFLQAQPGLEVSLSASARAVRVSYELTTYNLEQIEAMLVEAGFSLDNSLYVRVVNALAHFREETQQHNMHAPQRLIKNSNEVYVQAYEQHLHGDHDDTPADLRDVK